LSARPETSMRILVTGIHGQVGGELQTLLQPIATVVGAARPSFDLANPNAVRDYLREVQPDWIVNPAAYTAVDKAETEPDQAYAINAEGPRVLGKLAAELHIPILHFSTDYVFDGSGIEPRNETDSTGPLGVYGASKLAGEHALASTGAAHLIFRTSWVYGSRGKNFLLTILSLARQKEELRIVDDQHGAPTWSRDLARMVAHIVTRIASMPGSSNEDKVRSVQGVYHAASRGETTWFGFAQEFMRIAQETAPGTRIARLVPIASAEYPTPAKRPRNSRLNCTRLQEVFEFTMPDWRSSAAAVMDEVLKGGASPARSA
jgi:dTDP-4-dehydrorhamnose reductase